MKNSGGKSESNGAKKYLRPVTIGCAGGVIATVIMLCIMSLIVSAKDVPQMAINPMAVFSVSFGAFCAGFLCSKLSREKGLLLGSLCGLILFLIVLLASLMVGPGGFGLNVVFKFVFIMLCSAIGGVLGVNGKKRHR